MIIKNIILKVQSCGKDKFRLGIGSSDSDIFFKCRNRKIIIIFDSKIIETKTTCGTPLLKNENKKYKKGFDVYDKEINKWIKKENFIILKKENRLNYHLVGMV